MGPLATDAEHDGGFEYTDCERLRLARVTPGDLQYNDLVPP